MKNVTLKIKQLDKDKPFKVPTKAYGDAAAFDFYASEVEFTRIGKSAKIGDIHRDQLIYKFNMAVEFPSNYVMLLFPRSSIAKMDLRLANSVGVIDHDYRGEIMAKFDLYLSSDTQIYNPGDACIQALLIEKPLVNLIVLNDGEELSTTQRGTGGFGSSTDSNSIFGNAGEIRV